MKSLYKSEQSKAVIMALYDEKLKSLQINYEEMDVTTRFGRTRVLKTGNSSGKPIVVFHGINAGAPLTLEALISLRDTYMLYVIDTIGQATKSDENRINILDNSYALWADDVLGQLQLKEANFIGISYGSYILQKYVSHFPEKVSKCIFVVPSGLVNGKFWVSMKRLTFPLLRFLMTKKDNHLKAFIKAFVPEEDDFMFRLQKALLTGLNMDYRRPKLLQKQDVERFQNPVYMMVADDDIFFPGDAAVKRAQQLFNNLADVHILKNCRHMPQLESYPEIQQKIASWIG